MARGDEAQGIAAACDALVNATEQTLNELGYAAPTPIQARAIPAILAGLDLNFKGEPFGVMPVLMARAEQVDKLQAICMVCGEPASRTQRLVNGKPAHFNDPVIIVGASEMYEARCRAHHEVPRN